MLSEQRASSLSSERHWLLLVGTRAPSLYLSPGVVRVNYYDQSSLDPLPIPVAREKGQLVKGGEKGWEDKKRQVPTTFFCPLCEKVEL